MQVRISHNMRQKLITYKTPSTWHLGGVKKRRKRLRPQLLAYRSEPIDVKCLTTILKGVLSHYLFGYCQFYHSQKLFLISIQGAVVGLHRCATRNGHSTQPSYSNQESQEWFWGTLITYNLVLNSFFMKESLSRHHNQLCHFLWPSGAVTHISVSQLFRKHIWLHSDI